MESLGCLMSRVHRRTGTDKLVEKFLLLFLSSAFQVDISAALQTEDSCHMIKTELSVPSVTVSPSRVVVCRSVQAWLPLSRLKTAGRDVLRVPLQRKGHCLVVIISVPLQMLE